ncbi:MAG: hypothetical protein RMH84_04895, partial [Sulfolobales archaeon]|nr:hypothetical protein [Sulfolobales archaeon]MDW8010912.1 hypothetical protein [Sulfolobales archaeon]
GPYVTPSGRIFTLRKRKYVHAHQVLEEYAKSLKLEENGLQVFTVLKNLDDVFNYVKASKSLELLAVLRRVVKLEVF